MQWRQARPTAPHYRTHVRIWQSRRGRLRGGQLIVAGSCWKSTTRPFRRPPPSSCTGAFAAPCHNGESHRSARPEPHKRGTIDATPLRLGHPAPPPRSSSGPERRMPPPGSNMPIQVFLAGLERTPDKALASMCSYRHCSISKELRGKDGCWCDVTFIIAALLFAAGYGAKGTGTRAGADRHIHHASQI
jgi:hypothetical protein